MRKVLISLIYSLNFLIVEVWAQAPLPQPMPPYYINNLTLNATNGIELYQSETIISTSNESEPVNITGTAKVDYKASKEVELKPGFSARDFIEDGEFHAYIDELPFEMAWFEPTDNVGTVPKYEKLELGIKLPQDLRTKIHDYIYNCQRIAWASTNPCETDPQYINPFDTADISIDIDFISPDNRTIHKYGFYYEEYEVIIDPLDHDPTDFVHYSGYLYDPNTDTYYLPDINLSRWDQLPTDHNFRIRFAPDYIGYWTFNVKIWLGSSLLGEYDNGFQVIENPAENGFVVKDINNKYMKFSDPVDPSMASLFLLGDNSQGVGPMLYPQHHQLHKDWLKDIFDNGGNFTEIMQIPNSFGIEREDLGNYASVSHGQMEDIAFLTANGFSLGPVPVNRQVHAWEMDDKVEYIENYPGGGKFCQIALDMPGTYQGELLPPSNHHYNNWIFLGQSVNWNYFSDSQTGNPYNINTPFNYNRTPGVEHFIDFMDYVNNPEAMMYMKRKLRYISARWGYSPHIISYEVHGELNNEAYEGFDIDDVGQREIINNWVNKVCEYLKVWLKDPHLLTVSMVGMDGLEQPFSSDYIDFTDFSIYHYSSERDGNLEKAGFAESVRDTFDKPIFPGEYGDLNIPGGANPYCDHSDITFHNELWSTSFMGFFSAAMSWAFPKNYPLHRYNNLNAINQFMVGVDFEWNNFEPFHGTVTYPIVGGVNIDIGNPDNRREYFYLQNQPSNQASNQAMGWVHNRSGYWGNIINGLETNCYYVDGNDEEHFCPDDDLDCINQENHIYNLTEESVMFINDLDDTEEYQVQWYNTMDNTPYSEPAEVFPFFDAHFFLVPAMPAVGRLDYAFKLWPVGDEFKSLIQDESNVDTLRICLGGEHGFLTDLLADTNYNINNLSFSNDIKNKFVGIKIDELFRKTGWYKIGYTKKASSHGNQKGLIVKVTDCKEERNNNLVQATRNELVSPKEVLTINIMPNPSSGLFNVIISGTNRVTGNYSIFDATGKLILNDMLPSNLFILDLSFFPKGMYFLKIQMPDNDYNSKIIKF